MTERSVKRSYTPGETVGFTSPTVGAALRDATERAGARLTGYMGRSAEDVRTELELLVDTIRNIATAGNGASSSVGSANGSQFTRKLIDTLRTEYLAVVEEGGADRVDARDLLAILSAMEDLIRQVDRPHSREFAERLASSDGLNAVLEIAHDMRSPLTSILFLVETVRRGHGPVTPVQDRQLGLIYGAALGLSELASDIIDAVRGNGLGDSVPRPFSVSELMSDVCAIVAPIAEEKRLELTQVYPDNDGRIGHAPAVHRVLLNLTTNALKYTDSGSVAVSCVEVDAERVEFSVKDTGRGIPDRVMSMLFDGFRPGARGVRFSSAALGLAICRNLLEAMGTSLQVETSSETGTRFSFVMALPKV
jgi:signal transduction histidine kinase